jgi:polyhydroxybutyrate depolymerase
MLKHVIVVASLLVACNSNHVIDVSPLTADAGPNGSAGPNGPNGPNGSNGSSSTTCSGKPTPGSDETWAVKSSGVTRLIDVHVPPSYDPTQTTPLVLNFHGFTSDAIQEALWSLMNVKADKEGFVVMYPFGTGTPLSWNAGACCGTAALTGVDDIQFVRDILGAASNRLCIDPSRVYATGMSNGGFLSHRIGCELADRFAAIAPVAGVLGVPTCTPSRPMPVLEFHGTLDPLVPWGGNPLIGFQPVMDTFQGWATRNGCTGDSVQTYSHGDASCQTYQQCNGSADVTLCKIAGGGHTWPGGTPVPALGWTSYDINATDEIWTFFASHHL